MKSEFEFFKKKKLRNFCFRYFEFFLDNFFKNFDYEIFVFIQKEIRIIETKNRKFFFYSCYEYFMNYLLVGHIEKNSLSQLNLLQIKKFTKKKSYICKTKKKIKILQKIFLS
ncbi:hypothetical protein CMESO_343 (nucleomorph) [Chroomonas mesostigmatica CCMP1168]|uniref:Uncharacterized protein n=1 Tax=Chroomonas mesostigmatica CCMP1168 TaxID=1195612 RepID=J7GAK9_9CRYP|nr:hypothetical protein CMESO_343 [Chroomonas mesostigmatica CCMP1168]|mmetsp:Transcript_16600/g.40555  ORF Transcript_16600/g.40555 Transcript_16600/m.40555 type:complete len:112 (-) Transcript_16600:2242-2577(-)